MSQGGKRRDRGVYDRITVDEITLPIEMPVS